MKTFKLLIIVIVNVITFQSVMGGVFIASFNNINANGTINSEINFSGTIVHNYCCPVQLKVTANIIDMPQDWDYQICLSGSCELPGISNKTYTLDVGETKSIDIKIITGSILGTGTITVTIEDANNSSDKSSFNLTAITGQSTGVADLNMTSDDALYQNFPNPFSNSTTIKYVLKDKAGKLLIMNVLGTIIKEYDLQINNNGILNIQNELADGLYFYTLYIEGEPLITRSMQRIR